MEQQIKQPQSVVARHPAEAAFVLLAIIGALVYGIGNLDPWYTLAITIFVHQVVLLYLNLNHKLPVRNLIGSLFSLNFLLSPCLFYLWLNPFGDHTEEMTLPHREYFTYAIPCVVALLIGLYIFPRKFDEQIETLPIEKTVEQFPKLPLILIVTGVVCDVLMDVVPAPVRMLFSTLSNVKYVGFFMALLSKQGFNTKYFIVCYVVMLLRSIQSSMFNDFLNMLFFLGFFLCYKYKPTHAMKVGGMLAGIALVALIQEVKFPLRARANVSITNLDKFVQVMEESRAASKQRSTEEKIIKTVARLNQGWMLASTINYQRQGGFKFEGGKHLSLVMQIALLPRFMVPGGYTIGDIRLFNKYSGYETYEGTSIALGVFADGFIDFGRNGYIVAFLFGLMLNGIIQFFDWLKKYFYLAPIFAPACFFYIVRPDIDTQTTVGGVFKVTLILVAAIWAIHKFYLKGYDPYFIEDEYDF